jgi:hypothetical protein
MQRELHVAREGDPAAVARDLFGNPLKHAGNLP